MKNIILKIDNTLHGRTVRNILKQQDFSDSMIKKIKNTPDGILLNGKSAKTIDRVAVGDVISIIVPHTKSQIEPSPIPLSIIYEDDDIIAINKPRSMPTHPSFEHTTDTLLNALMFHLNSNATLHPITRLDKDTSGIVLVAKNPLSASILTNDIQNKKIHKEYVAVICGTPPISSGTISAPIKKSDNNGISRIVSPDGKEAVTDYDVIKHSNGLSLVRLCPITGRTHQLRVHMNYIGCPIYGDWLYNPNPADGKTRLHCSSLTFFHPTIKEKLTLTAPIPDDFSSLIN